MMIYCRSLYIKGIPFKEYAIIYDFKIVSMKYFQVTLKWPIYTFDNKYKEHFCEK